jgi:hypothetical protein
MPGSPVDDTTNAAFDAIEEAVRKCTVGIVSGSCAQLWQGIGTGTLIHWRGQHFILTAEHVIGETSPADLRFFLPNDAPPLMVDRDVLLSIPGVPTSALRPFSQLEPGRIERDRHLDLAAVHVSESIETKYPATFFDLTDEGVGPQVGQTSLVLGFPYDVSRVLKNESRVVFTQVDWWPVEPYPSDLPGFDRSVHFLTRYSPPATYPNANPRGLSGAARWTRKGNTPGVWHPNMEIIGVTVTYYPAAGLLKMVRRDAVMRFLTSTGAA